MDLILYALSVYIFALTFYAMDSFIGLTLTATGSDTLFKVILYLRSQVNVLMREVELVMNVQKCL